MASIAALPVLILLCATSAVIFRTWPLFLQTRVGRFGKLFTIVKIRSLPRHVPEATDKYHLRTVEIGWFSRMIRGSHLDEVPQLLLVPLGRMSLVGPRPEMPEMIGRYPQAQIDARVSVRPGCTGLWQVSKDSSRMMYENPDYDIFYARNLSVGLDLWILGKTILMVTTKKVIELSDVPDTLSLQHDHSER